MATKITGIVEALSKDGKRFKLDDENWYGCFTPSQLKASRGDMVEFNYEQVTKGENTYNNVKGNVRVVGTAPTSMTEGAPSAPSPSSGYSRPSVPMGLLPVQLARERAIIRQNALTSAVNYHSYESGEHLSAAEIIDTARIFEAYTSGDYDIAEANKPEKGVGPDAEGNWDSGLDGTG